MVIRELVARISYQLNRSSVRNADATIKGTKESMNDMGNSGSSAWDRIASGAARAKASILGVGKQALYTSEQLAEMGAYQDRLGRWHSANGKFLKINADTSSAGANLDGLQGKLSSLTNATATLGRALVAAFAIDRIIAFTQAIQKTADEMMNLDGRLRTITETDSERFAIEDNLYKLAQQNRQGMNEMGNLYFKIANGTKKYGFNNEDFMRATDIVSKSLTIGGASTAEASSTILQLGQALGSGFLMGDELNSLNENAQPLMQKIAAYFGKDIGELKEMGSQRELKSEDIMRAILSAGEAMDDEFSKMPVTISQALQKASNSWDRFIQLIQRKTNIFGSIADFISNQIDFVSNTIENVMSVFETLSNIGVDGDVSGLSAGGLRQYEELQKQYPILTTIYTLWVQIKDVINSIGEAFQPIVDMFNNVDITSGILQGIQMLKDVFSGLASTLQPALEAASHLMQAFAPAIEKIGPIFIEALVTGFGVLATVLQYIIEFFTWLIEAAAEFLEEHQEIADLILVIGGAILLYLLSPILAAIAAVGALIMFFKWCAEQIGITWDYFTEKASNAIDSAKQFFSDLGSWAMDIIKEIADYIETWIITKLNVVKSGLSSLGGFVSGTLEGLGNSLSNAYNNITQNNTYNVNSPEEVATIEAANELGVSPNL